MIFLKENVGHSIALMKILDSSFPRELCVQISFCTSIFCVEFCIPSECHFMFRQS